ncbi:MAG: hypothetical protein V4617_18685 [Gemmatimonadota bacterium]
MISRSRPLSSFAVALPRTVVACAALSLVAACNDEGTTDPVPTAPRGIVVLDGFIQPGLTFLSDTGSASTKLSFGPPTEFDAGGFTLENDTVLAVSSRGAGDLLYIADVRAGTVRKVQLPAASNPGKARLLRNTVRGNVIGVALRDANRIALVEVPATAAVSVNFIENAGTCPTDVFQYSGATWVVDANANCKTNYAVLGDARIIRIPNTGTARDTINLPGARSSGVSVIVQGDVAYVAAGGVANFSTSPFTLVSPGTVTRVDLRNRQVLGQRVMPAGTYGASTKLGGDGFLYVSLYESLATFRNRTIKLRSDDLSIVSSGASPYLALTTAAGADAACGSAVADGLGRVHCLISSTGSVTSLVVFNPSGTEIRRVAAGQGGVDLALR